MKRQKREAKLEAQRIAQGGDVAAPVKGLFTPDELMDKFNIDVDGVRARRDAEAAAKAKKKKKKKESDLFFEGGEGILPEYDA